MLIWVSDRSLKFKSHKLVSLIFPSRVFPLAPSLLHLSKWRHLSSHCSVPNPWTRAWLFSFSHTTLQSTSKFSHATFKSDPEPNHFSPPPTTATQDQITIMSLFYYFSDHPRACLPSPLPLNQLSSTYGRISLFEYSQFTTLLCSKFQMASISPRIKLKVYMLFLGPERHG